MTSSDIMQGNTRTVKGERETEKEGEKRKMGCETQTQETDTYSCLKIESNYRVKRVERDKEKKRERE